MYQYDNAISALVEALGFQTPFEVFGPKNHTPNMPKTPSHQSPFTWMSKENVLKKTCVFSTIFWRFLCHSESIYTNSLGKKETPLPSTKSPPFTTFTTGLSRTLHLHWELLETSGHICHKQIQCDAGPKVQGGREALKCIMNMKFRDMIENKKSQVIQKNTSKS